MNRLWGRETESFRGNYDLPDRNVSLMPLMFIPEPDGECIRNATKDSPLDTVCVCAMEYLY